jgi:hypothetical protein
MCRPASFVVLKGKVFWSETSDSHEAIIKEFNINMDTCRGPAGVRVELTPPNNWDGTSLKGWVYQLDQDRRPDWYDEEEVKAACEKALPKWAKFRVAKNNQTITEGSWVVGGKRKVKLEGGELRAYSKSSVTQSGGDCWLYHTATNNQSGGWCYLHHNATNNQSGGNCRLWDNATNNQSGGECRLNDNTTNNQSEGKCWLYHTATNNQSGGDCVLYGNSTNNQSGGYCVLYDNTTNNQSGGYCNLYDNATNNQSGGDCVRHSKKATLNKI